MTTAGVFQGTVCGLTTPEGIDLEVKPHWFIAGRSFVATVPLSNAITDLSCLKGEAVRPTDPAPSHVLNAADLVANPTNGPEVDCGSTKLNHHHLTEAGTMLESRIRLEVAARYLSALKMKAPSGIAGPQRV